MSDASGSARDQSVPPSMVQCAIEGDLESAREALAADPGSVRTRDDGIDSTPLHFAAHRGHLAIVELLIEHGADVDAREGCSGTTPLHWAAEGGHPGVVQALLGSGAALEPIESWYELRPVDWTAAVNHAPGFHASRDDARGILAAAGSEPGVFALVELGNVEGIRRLVDRDPSVLSSRLGPVGDRRTPLHAAVLAARSAVVQALLQAGADATATTSRGLTAAALAMAQPGLGVKGLPTTDDLPAALLRQDWRSADLALQSSPGALAADGEYAGLLHWTAEMGLDGPSSWLLEHGADPDGESVFLCYDEWLGPLRPLHRSAHKGQLTTTRQLLNAGAQVNVAGGRSALTPLHLAAVSGHLDVVRTLVAAGADTSARDTMHQATPRGWALYAQRGEVASYLGAR